MAIKSSDGESIDERGTPMSLSSRSLIDRSRRMANRSSRQFMYATHQLPGRAGNRAKGIAEVGLQRHHRM